MDTIKIDRGTCKMIAHRGASGLERENTCAAFVAAAQRTYFGIETDVHVTKDGKFAIIHDNDLNRVAGVDMNVEESTLADLQSIRLFDKDDATRRSDLIVPTLEDYISICHRYGKEAVLELKNDIAPEHIAGIVDTIEQLGHLDATTFISFHHENLLRVRALRPECKAQFLPPKNEDWIFKFCVENRIDLDIYHTVLTPEIVAMIHGAGLRVNCWTVDDVKAAERVLGLGVDFITSNILE